MFAHLNGALTRSKIKSTLFAVDPVIQLPILSKIHFPMQRTLVFLSLICLPVYQVLSQTAKSSVYLNGAILTDSSSTLFIPVHYKGVLLDSDNKVAFGDSHYANIIVYDFKRDQYKTLFEKDTFIEAFVDEDRYRNESSSYKNIHGGHVLLTVRTTDTNKNGRIDSSDAAALYTVSTRGENLKLLTAPDESVLHYALYRNQNLALVKILLDSNGDGSFKKEDRICYRSLNFDASELGKRIEIN